MDRITCCEVTKRFGSRTALNAVSFGIPPGEIFGLLGPNGSGKTTLIRIMNRIAFPDSGRVLFEGHPVQAADTERIGYMPEERGLYRKMKVGEQALFLARLKGMGSAEAMRELKEWFSRFGIQGWWNRKVEELSKGMAQKVQFIVTVLHKPSLLILDEPFSGFDPVNAQLIRNEILRLKEEGATIILSTHNMESVEELCDSIALINRSELVVSGSVDRIRREYGNHRVRVQYRSGGSLSQLPGAETLPFGIVSDREQGEVRTAELEVPRETGNARILGALLDRVDIVSYQQLMPRMNDIFIKLVTGREP